MWWAGCDTKSLEWLLSLNHQDSTWRSAASTLPRPVPTAMLGWEALGTMKPLPCQVTTNPRGNVVTTSITVVEALGSDSMANTREPLLTVVTTNKPKMLTGLNQKVRGQEQGSPACPSRRHQHHRRISGAYPIVALKRNVVSPLFSRKGRQPQGTSMK